MEPKDDGTPSIWEVAKSVGVSVATISRVLNGKGPVRADTRERVLAAIAEMGYVPHSAARSLSTRRTMSIGVLLPDIYGEFFSELIRGIDQVAKRTGYHVLVSGSHSDPQEVQALLHALHGRVDGIVIMAPIAPIAPIAPNTSSGGEVPEPIVPKGVPWIALGRGFAGRGMAIQIDNVGGARSVVHHLADLGHRHIAMIAGPKENSDAADRHAGYVRALSERGIALDPSLLFEGDFREESGHRAAHAILARQPRPTAIFAANDAMAIGCLAALSEQGLAVPADMALAGFDDIPIARYLTPQLTSVRVAIAELGSRAMERLLSAIENPNDPEVSRKSAETIAATLVVRGSTVETAARSREAPT